MENEAEAVARLRAEFEQHTRGTNSIIACLVQKLGGKVRLKRKEIDAQAGGMLLWNWTDDAEELTLKV
jgi:hypothetical protein